MNKIRLFAVAVTCAATMSVLSPTMSASMWDKRTTVTFSGAVEVPGTVLQPGRYIMKLVDSPADRHIVQFSNERENHVFATVLAIPAQPVLLSYRWSTYAARIVCGPLLAVDRATVTPLVE